MIKLCCTYKECKLLSFLFLFTIIRKGCTSFVGRQGGRQIINLEEKASNGGTCWTKGTVIHEIGWCHFSIYFISLNPTVV